MRYLKHLAPIGAAALLAASVLAGSASATTLSPASTAFTATATNWTLTVSGSAVPITCAHSTISGTTPASGGVTWVSQPYTENWAGCTMGGFPLTVNPSHSCHTAGTQPILHIHQITPLHSVQQLTDNGCTIHIVNHITGCTERIPPGLTIGNGTAGVGGSVWRNLSPKSALDFNTTTVPTVVSNGVGSGCPPAGAQTGAISANFTIVSATNVTVTP